MVNMGAVRTDDLVRPCAVPRSPLLSTVVKTILTLAKPRSLPTLSWARIASLPCTASRLGGVNSKLIFVLFQSDADQLAPGPHSHL
jgi:hypothetical protein